MSNATPGWVNDGKHDRDVARFVLEGDDFVNHVVSRAVDELYRLTEHKHRTFAAALAEGGRDTLRAAAEALYLHLKQDYHLRYEFERAFDEATGAQQLRLPAAVSRENRGTCIDLALLFLSCLANAKLRPVYVHLRLQGGASHALAATWLKEPVRGRPLFLSLPDLRRSLRAGELVAVECTGFAEGYPGRPHKLSFAEACQEAQALLEGCPGGDFGFALDVGRAWESGIRPGSLVELEASLDSCGREEMFRPGGLCQGYPLRALPDRYFVGKELGPEEDLRGALADALAGLRMRPVCGEDEIWPGHVLCKLAAMIRGTAFGVYQIAPAQDRNVYLELGMAVGIGRPFLLVREPGADLPGLLEGLDHFRMESYFELRHGLAPKVREFLVEAGRESSVPLPKVGSRAAAVIAHGGLDVLDFAVTAGKAVAACGLTPVFLGDPSGKLRAALEQEGIDGKVLGASGGWRLDETVAAIQAARLGIYRVERAASADAFVALGISLGLSRPGLLVRRAGQEVPADLKGLSTVEFRAYTALRGDLARLCGDLLHTRLRGRRP